MKENAKLGNISRGVLKSSPGSSSPKRTALGLVPCKEAVVYFQDPRLLNLQQDNMYQPLSRYWINSSLKTQVI